MEPITSSRSKTGQNSRMRAISNNHLASTNDAQADDIGPPIGDAIQKPFPSNCPRHTSGGLEWVQLMDFESNKYFWFSESTNVSLWDKPTKTRIYYDEDGSIKSTYSVRIVFLVIRFFC